MTSLKILKPKSRFKLLTMEEVFEMPDPKWIIQDIISEMSLAQLYGKPGLGKSFVVLDMALCIATGAPWLGTHKVTQGPVVYVAAEGSRGMKKRGAAWLEHHGLGVSDLHDFRLIGEAVSLGNPSDVRSLIRQIQETFDGRDIAMVVLDTQARCTEGLEENNATDMGIMIAAADRIKNTLGTAVKLIHHSGLEGGRGRGSTAVHGALDFQSVLLGEGYNLVLKCDKTKDDEDFKPIKITLNRVGDSLVPVSRVSMSASQYLAKA